MNTAIFTVILVLIVIAAGSLVIRWLEAEAQRKYYDEVRPLEEQNERDAEALRVQRVRENLRAQKRRRHDERLEE